MILAIPCHQRLYDMHLICTSSFAYEEWSSNDREKRSKCSKHLLCSRVYSCTEDLKMVIPKDNLNKPFLHLTIWEFPQRAGKHFLFYTTTEPQTIVISFEKTNGN